MVRPLISSSERPSQKNSLPGSGLMFAKGRTTMEKAGGAAAGVPGGAGGPLTWAPSSVSDTCTGAMNL